MFLMSNQLKLKKSSQCQLRDKKHQHFSKYFIFVISMEMRENNQSHVAVGTLFEVKRT
jgi:hypothetical protein